MANRSTKLPQSFCVFLPPKTKKLLYWSRWLTDRICYTGAVMTNTVILELCSKKGQTTQTSISLSKHEEPKSDLYFRLTLLTLLSLYSETPSFSAISDCQIFQNFRFIPYWGRIFLFGKYLHYPPASIG